MKVAFTIVLLCAAACTPGIKNSQIIDFGAFTLKTTGEWRKVERQGLDSNVGGLTNGTDSVWFDYGNCDVDLNFDSGFW
jgi:hypothetical protein